MVGLIVAGAIWIQQEIFLSLRTPNFDERDRVQSRKFLGQFFFGCMARPSVFFRASFFILALKLQSLSLIIAYHWRAHPLHRERSINSNLGFRFGLSSNSTEISTNLFNTLPAGSRLKFICACFVEV